eukprot:gene5858-11828_t
MESLPQNSNSYNPWLNATIWVMVPSSPNLWRKAIALHNIPADVLHEEWEFVVQLEDELIYTIRTVAVDEFNLEFTLVKRRNESQHNIL